MPELVAPPEATGGGIRGGSGVTRLGVTVGVAGIGLAVGVPAGLVWPVRVGSVDSGCAELQAVTPRHSPATMAAMAIRATR